MKPTDPTLAGLVERDTWEQKWERLSSPRQLDRAEPGDRAFVDLILANFGRTGDDRTMFEVGCGSGRFMAFFARELGFRPFGIDYTSAGVENARRNCELLGVDATVCEGDFRTFVPSQQFDCVVSAGFIEHFDAELEAVLAKHAMLVKPGGKLLLSMPNFRYLNYALAWMWRRDMLRKHNVEIMHPEFLRQFARRYDFDVDYLGYFGGPHPAGAKLRISESRGVQSALAAALRALEAIRRRKMWDRVNSRLFSHYLGAVLTKRDTTPC